MALLAAALRAPAGAGLSAKTATLGIVVEDGLDGYFPLLAAAHHCLYLASHGASAAISVFRPPEALGWNTHASHAWAAHGMVA
jgi:hypothetical protein